MATARPVVSVYQFDNPAEKASTLPMPAVLTSALRPDLVNYIHTNVSKNKRQAYSVSRRPGYGFAAESWGTGRAVARIPRVPGGGTNRSGQAAFGNQARGGGMFCPTKTWRRWHRRVNVTMKRHAVASALAASCLPPLVMARGHRIEGVAELPLVVSDGAQNLQKTKNALDMLKKVGCEPELSKINDSRKVRGGVSKIRNRRYAMRRGPLVIYAEDSGIVRAFRNIPGVETACVDRLNLLQLAPGGTFGRFIIWTEGAFKRLEEIYGSAGSSAPLKKDYFLPRGAMENADVARIINSTEVQSVLRPKLESRKTFGLKKNPLKNKQIMARLNPGSLQKREARKRAHEKGTKERDIVEKKAKLNKQESKKSKGGKAFYANLMKAFEEAKLKAEAAAGGAGAADDEEDGE